VASCHPEEVVQRLSRELEGIGYFNIISEDAKTIILLWCGGRCSPMLMRVDEGSLRVVIPVVLRDADPLQLAGKISSMASEPASVDVIRLDGGVFGLEVSYALRECLDLSYIERVIREAQSFLEAVTSEYKGTPIEADIIA